VAKILCAREYQKHIDGTMKLKEKTNPKTLRTAVIVIINVSVALLNLVNFERFHGPGHVFVTGYLFDILLPFALYFLLCLPESTIFRLKWQWKVALIVGFGTIVELSQMAGLPIFGATFDPLDIFAYAVGVTIALAVDKFVLSRCFPFWRIRP
jgi:hypothetical protein